MKKIVLSGLLFLVGFLYLSAASYASTGIYTVDSSGNAKSEFVFATETPIFF
ncbi:hypothetical protein HZA55_01505 [Candidatus Poribacteria bacterium]|nr:hypothetical protein [Candidatus Poribacteria bacterium]